MDRALLISRADKKSFLVDGELLIGGSAGCGLRLKTPSASGIWARIESSGRDWYIRDENSSVGIWVNHLKLPAGGSMKLTNGCEIKIGSTVFNFSEDEQAVEDFVFRNTCPPPQAAPVPVIRKKKSSRAGLIVSLVLAAVIAAGFFVWCGVFHSKAVKLMEAGNYEAAAAAFAYDPVFSGRDKLKAHAALARSLMAEGNYTAALPEIEKAGIEGRELRPEAVYNIALGLRKAGRSKEAADMLTELAGEERGRELYGLCRLDLLWELYEKKGFEAAAAAAEREGEYVDTEDFMLHLHRREADKCILAGDYKGAYEHMSKCSSMPFAENNAEVLGMAASGQVREAALKSYELIADGETDIERSSWWDVIMAAVEDIRETKPEAEKLLYLESTEKILNSEIRFNPQGFASALREALPDEGIISRTLPYDDMGGSGRIKCAEISDMDALYSACGLEPGGKILIIIQQHNADDDRIYNSLALRLMEELPEELMASSYAEAEYIITIKYNYGPVGRYEGKTEALQQNAVLQLEHMPGKTMEYYGYEIYGGYPDETLYVSSGELPEYAAGGMPDVAEELSELIESIYEKNNK